MQITHKVESRDNYFISLVSRFSGKWFQGGFADCTFQNTNSEMETNTQDFIRECQLDETCGREGDEEEIGRGRGRDAMLSQRRFQPILQGVFPSWSEGPGPLQSPVKQSLHLYNPKKVHGLGQSLFLVLEIPEEELQLTSVSGNTELQRHQVLSHKGGPQWPITASTTGGVIFREHADTSRRISIFPVLLTF